MSDEVKLPEPTVPSAGIRPDLFSSDQLRAYGEACRKDERKKCAHDVMRAADSVMRIETEGMEGDNLAVTLCSSFERFDDSAPGENGWSEEVMEKYDEVKAAISGHFQEAIRARSTP